MDRRPLIFRTVIVAIVVATFCLALHPLMQRDYYEVFKSMLKNKQDKQALALIEQAKQLQAKDPRLFQSQALLDAAKNSGVDIRTLVKRGPLGNSANPDPAGTVNGFEDARDVLSLIRKKASSSIRLGLDLNGGVEFYLELVPDEELRGKYKKAADGKGGSGADEAKIEIPQEEFDRYRDVAIEALRRRLEGKKIFEAEITPSGDRYVVLRAPIVTEDEKKTLMELISMSAKLSFHLVHPENARLVREYEADPQNFKIPYGYDRKRTTSYRPGDEPKLYFIRRRPAMRGKGVDQAFPTKNEFGQRKIALRFNADGTKDFGRITTDNKGSQLAIVLDEKLYCAPVIQEPILNGNAEISGNFSDEEVKTIADVLVSGNFPFLIKVKGVFDTDPKLGADNVANGVWVGLASLLCVALFMIIYYRFSGLIAVAALALNMVLILGAMAAFDCTLTLPGIAGLVLTIGMAVDANVLVFERIREELESGNKLRTAVDLGYSRAFSAVFDSNITTLLTSFILMYVGTGAVKGFGVTLSIGILSSLFTALFVTRLIFDYLFRFTSFNHISMLGVFRNTKYGFMKMYKWSALFSGLMIVLLIVTLAVRGKSVLGVDFTGGTTVTCDYTERYPQDQIEKFLKSKGYKEPSVTYKSTRGDKKIEITIRGDLTAKNKKHSPKDELLDELNNKFKKADFRNGSEASVGGLIGREFIKAALWAIGLSLVGIGIYISLRYEFLYAVSGVLMLMHDVAVVLAIYLVFGRTISLTVIAALLTVIGYSINDNVVIFDRIRENRRLNKCGSFGEYVDMSVNQTLSRTLITSVTTFIVVFILFIFGGVAINDFVFIMMLGVVLGTYSSVFLAAPTVAFLRRMGARDSHGSHVFRPEGK